MTKASNTAQFESALAPVVAFNKLVVKNVEQAFNMQVATLQAYAELGMKNINAGLEVRSADDLKVYTEKQGNVVKEFTERVSADAKAFGELNTKFINEARALAEKNVKTVAESAKAA